MEEIIKKFNEWKKDYDEGRIYDEISEFFDAELSRGECLSVIEFVVENFTSNNTESVPCCDACGSKEVNETNGYYCMDCAQEF